MFYPYQDWIDNPERFIYLGSEINPSSKMKYDYWAVRTNDFKDSINNWSATCRHGMDDCEYGSMPICVGWYNTTHLDSSRDYVFGIERAMLLMLYYLATNRKPLLETERAL